MAGDGGRLRRGSGRVQFLACLKQRGRRSRHDPCREVGKCHRSRASARKVGAGALARPFTCRLFTSLIIQVSEKRKPAFAALAQLELTAIQPISPATFAASASLRSA
jgi:hypothetical protein